MEQPLPMAVTTATTPAPLSDEAIALATAAVTGEKPLVIDPLGYLVLVRPVVPAEKTKGGIIRPDQVIDQQRLLAQVGEVLDLGPDAYADAEKFPHGPRCKVGDFVLFGRMAGVRVELPEGHLRLLNDDEVLARVNDPSPFL